MQGVPEPAQVPLPSHRSVAVQNRPSSHGVLLEEFGFEHSPASHTSSVHGLPSAQWAAAVHSSPTRMKATLPAELSISSASPSSR